MCGFPELLPTGAASMRNALVMVIFGNQALTLTTTDGKEGRGWSRKVIVIEPAVMEAGGNSVSK